MPGMRPHTRGQSLVEFALMGPVFFVLLLGTIDFGRAVYIYNSLADAAREGARAAVAAQSPLPSNADILDAINGKLGGGFALTLDPCVNLPTPCTSMQNPPSAANTGVIWFTNPRPVGRNGVSVQIVYSFSPWVPLISTVAGSNLQLKARTTMVTEY